MTKDTEGKHKSFDADRLIKRMEFDEIISEALDATRPGGTEGVVLEKQEVVNTDPAQTVHAETKERSQKSSWHLVAMIALAFVVVNVAVIGLFGADKEGVLTESEAIIERQQKFGQEARTLKAVDNFLKNDGYRGVQDATFAQAVEDLNQALGLIDDPENEPFVADDFRFLDSEFVYRPRQTNSQ